MNPEDGSDFLGTMPSMDDASMMLVDEMFDFVKSKPAHYVDSMQQMCMPAMIGDNSVNVHIDDNQQLFSLKEELQSSSDGDTGSDTPFDPNDFFNDIYKSEVSYSSFSSPTYRNTPSPSNSQSSGSDHSSDCNLPNGSHQSDPTIHLYGRQPVQVCQSQDVTPMDFAQTLSTIHEQQTSAAIPLMNQMASGTEAPNKINIIQGTLIPIKAVSLSPPHNTFTAATPPATQTTPMKKIKIQPKPMQTANGVANHPSIQKSNIKPKTIVLSASDYKALMLKCKTQPATTANDRIVPLTLKTSPTVSVATPAAPNSNPKVIKLLSASIAPTVTTSTTTVPAKVMPIDLKPIKIERMNVSSVSKMNGIKQEIDDRTLKKQMRMIKNRESACLSRKKKKDYVTSLEARISDLSKENQQLKSENCVLKDRLSSFANRGCDICGGMSANKSKSGPLSALSNVPKKNAAFLLAFVFMFSLHVGPYLSNQMPDLTSPDNSISPSEFPIGTRRLLWIDDAANDSNASPTSDEGTNSRTYPMCPVSVSGSVNQTESIRLASELQRWIGDFPEYFNISKNSNSKNANNFDLNEISDYLLSDAGGRAIKSFYKQIKNVGKHMKKSGKEGESGTDPSYHRKNSVHRTDSAFGVQTARNAGGENRVQVYNADTIKYAEFFDEIRRQDDTFYVVSFKGDHLLLPAVAHNKTNRPKMSLMLPAVGNVGNRTLDSNGYFTLMQIDCEVVNTSMLHIKESSIPDHLWNRTSSKKSASDSSMPMAPATRKATIKAERFQRNSPNAQSIVDKISRNRLENNVTTENRRRPQILPIEASSGGSDDPVAAAAHVEPLKPHRPYFLHKNIDTNAEKLLNEV